MHWLITFDNEAFSHNTSNEIPTCTYLCADVGRYIYLFSMLLLAIRVAKIYDEARG